MVSPEGKCTVDVPVPATMLQQASLETTPISSGESVETALPVIGIKLEAEDVMTGPLERDVVMNEEEEAILIEIQAEEIRAAQEAAESRAAP